MSEQLTYEDWKQGKINSDINDLYFDGVLSIDDHTKIMEELMTLKDKQIEKETNQLKKLITQLPGEKQETALNKEIRKMERFILDEKKRYNDKYGKIKERKLTLYPSTDLIEIKMTAKGAFIPKNTKVYDFIQISVLTNYYEWLVSYKKSLAAE